MSRAAKFIFVIAFAISMQVAPTYVWGKGQLIHRLPWRLMPQWCPSLSQLGACLGGPVWTFLQDSQNDTCGGSTNTCADTLSATTAGSVLVAGMFASVLTTDPIASVSGGGGTWSLCAASGCQVLGPAAGSNTIDMAYNITGTGGATSITVTDTNSKIHAVAVDEFQCIARCGGIVLDKVASTQGSSASCTSCTMPAFTALTGVSKPISDLFVVMNNFANTLTPPSPFVEDANENFAYALNYGTGTAGTATQSPAGAFQTSGITFK